MADGRKGRGQKLTAKTASDVAKRLRTDPKNSEATIVKNGRSFGASPDKNSKAYNRLNSSKDTMTGPSYMYNPKKKKK